MGRDPSLPGGILSRQKTPNRASETDQARDDLFSHVHRCGVAKATEEQQIEWMNDTMEYIGECYPSLGTEEIEELKAIGLRFCRPAVPRGSANDASGEELIVAEEIATEEVSVA